MQQQPTEFDIDLVPLEVLDRWHQEDLNLQRQKLEELKNNLSRRRYYPLEEAAQLLSCSVDSLIHWGANGMIRISIYVEEMPIPNQLKSNDGSPSHYVLEILDTYDAVGKLISGEGPMRFTGLMTLDDDCIKRFECTGHWGTVSLQAPFRTVPCEELTKRLIGQHPPKLFITESQINELQRDGVKKPSSNTIKIDQEKTAVRQDGLYRCIAALAAGFLGSSEDLDSKAGVILDTIEGQKQRGGLKNVELPDVKTLRRYLREAALTLK